MLTICGTLNECLEDGLDEAMQSEKCDAKTIAKGTACVVGGILLDSCAYLGACIFILSGVATVSGWFHKEN